MPRGHAYHAVPTGPAGSSFSAHGGVQSFSRPTSEANFSDAGTASDARFAAAPRPQPQSRACAFACICIFSSAMGATAALALTQLYAPAAHTDDLSLHRASSSPEQTDAGAAQVQRKTAVSNDELALLFAHNAVNGLDEAFTADSFPQWRSDRAQGRRSLLLNSPFKGWDALQILDDVVRVTSHLAQQSLEQGRTKQLASFSDSSYRNSAVE